MPSTKRFDGPNLEAVLADVQDTHGESARILNAHRVRAGGLAGFFAKERFEVEVEVDADAVDDDDAGLTADEGPAAAAGDAGPGADGYPEMRVPASILDLADDVSAQESGTAPRAFASVLAARLSAEHARASLASVDAGDGHPSAQVHPNAPRRGRATPPAGPAVDAMAADTTDEATEAAERGITAAAPPPVDHADHADHADHDDDVVGSAGRPAFAAGLRPEPLDVYIRPPGMRREAPAPTPPIAIAFPESRPDLSPAVPARTTVIAGAPMSPAVEKALSELTRRGLPPALLPSGPDAAGRAALVAALDRLPAVPTLPLGRAAVVATVGEREEALELAIRVSEEHGADPDEILLASPGYRGRRIAAWRRMSTVDEAVSARRSWRRRTNVTVIAVEAPVHGDEADWAASILAALEPNLAWGIVHAGAKTEDLAWWVDRLGGIDALSVNGTARTVTPGGVLSLGIPVGLLDGEEATSEGWASILLAGAGR